MESCLPHGRQGLREDSIVYQSMYSIMLIIAHPNFGRIEGAAGQWRHATLRCVTDCPPSRIDSQLRPCIKTFFKGNLFLRTLELKVSKFQKQIFLNSFETKKNKTIF